MVLFSRRGAGSGTSTRGSLSSFLSAFGASTSNPHEASREARRQANRSTNNQPRRTRRGNPSRHTRTAPRQPQQQQQQEPRPRSQSSGGINAQIFNEWFESMFAPQAQSQNQNQNGWNGFPRRPARPQAASTSSVRKNTTLNSYGGANFQDWSIKELKSFLSNYNVDMASCIEKSDLVEECRKLTWPLPPCTDEEAHQCRICFDRRIDVVLIPCGHQWCSVCSYQLKCCPSCQAPIDSRLRTYR